MSKKKLAAKKLSAERIMESLFDLSEDVRYIAIYRNGKLDASSRSNLRGASSSESDTYEEIIVNPTLLTLVRQRGEIDCGGVEYVIIRYGNFFQSLHPVRGGHISVAFEPECRYEKFLPQVQDIVRKRLS